MSLSRSAVIGIALLAAVGCEAAGPSVTTYREELAKVTVSAGNSRIGQLYSHKLDHLLNRHGNGESRYELNVTLNSSESSDAVTMSAAISLYDRSTGETIATKSLNSSASVGAVSSLYGSEEAKRHASERLAGHLADKSYHYLLLHFSRGAEAN